ncbi:hypothetical protein [Actinoplanes sp. NPDC051494]|uniref:hypothetical protein n=1 Tax=Actinoplanes sp. NPDC051494 TaxID=3363907 RepID=UPI003796426F
MSGDDDSGAGRPVLAVLVGALIGLVPSVFIYSGAGRSNDLGVGSLWLAVLVWLVTSVGAGWTLYRKGWRA